MFPDGLHDAKRAQDLETERSDSTFWVRHVLMVSLWEGRWNLEVGLTYKVEMTAPTSDGLRRLEIVSVEFLAHWGASRGHSAKGAEVHVAFHYLHPKPGGFPGGASGKEPTCQYRRHKRPGFDPLVGKIPWRGKWRPTEVFLP